MKIKEILGNNYIDFLEYCSVSGKIIPEDILPYDYVAFRTQYGKTREYIKELKEVIEKGCAVSSEDDISESESGDISIDDISLDESIGNDFDVDSGEIESLSEESEESETEQKSEKNTFDYHTPLYVLFGLSGVEPYLDVKIDALRQKGKVNKILKWDGRESVADLLKCTIAQIFDLCSISKTSLAKIINNIYKFTQIDTNSAEFKSKLTGKSLAYLYNIQNPDCYSNVDVRDMGFKTRMVNSLLSHNIRSLAEMLMLSVEGMQQWNSLGQNSIDNAIEILEKYFQSESSKFQHQFSLNKDSVNRVIAIVEGSKVFDIAELNEKEKELYDKIVVAIDDCGEEFYYAEKENPEYFLIISKALNEFHSFTTGCMEQRQILQDFCNGLPDELKSTSAKVLAEVYYQKNEDSLKDFWLALPVDCKFETVSELVNFSEIATDLDDLSSKANEIDRFFIWLKGIDIQKLSSLILSDEAFVVDHKVNNELKDKYWLVLEMRSEGATLDNIGSLINATRERVRQIEKKYTRLLASYYKSNRYDLISLIHAFRDGDIVLKRPEVEEYIGKKQTNLLWMILSQGLLDCSTYEYNKSFDAVVFCGNYDEDTFNNAIQSLPEYFFEDQTENIIAEALTKFGVNRELLEMEIDRRYRLYGKYHSQSAPLVPFMCEYILKTKFPNGYKLADENDGKHFHDYLVDLFGEKGEMKIRAMEAKIGEVGVLCDRGRYISPEYVKVEPWIIQRINKYIKESDKTVLAYSEIYEGLKDIFLGTQITNRFMMQGAMKLYGCRYLMTRDYVTKEKGRSLTDQFEEFALQRGEFSKQEFFAMFPSMKDANLGMLVARCKSVFNIDNGMYMHDSLLTITAKDKTDIRKYLNELCADGPVHSRHIYEEFEVRFSDFLEVNQIFIHTKLFGVLFYMFGDEFNFSRPYISKDKGLQLTNDSVILHYFDGYDKISIEDAMDICADKQSKHLTSGYIIKTLSPEFVRINETTLMRKELTGIDDDVVLEVVSQVYDRVEATGYCSSAMFNDFLLFPDIKVEWNSYLVESIVELSADIIKSITIPSTNYSNLSRIFVSDEYAKDDYQSFILKIVNDAYDRDYFSTKKELLDYLKENGLVSSYNMPNFLDGTDYFYMDDSGRLRRS